METSLSDNELPNDVADPQPNATKSDSLAEMTEQEMSQHLSLCLKLAAENKINTKNAFGLHLIGIMRHWIRQETPDLQFASLSLQASSKIYAGRVEALYKDTFAFHNQLQTIVSNKRVTHDREQADDDEGGDGSEERRERRKAKSKQTYLTTEDNVCFKSETNYTSTAPHSNFVTIRTAFTTSRSAPKLLDGLALENDSSKLCCTNSLPCFNAQKPTNANDFTYPEKRRALLKKVLNLKSNCIADESSMPSNVFESIQTTSPAALEFDLNSEDSFCIGASPVRDDQDHDVQEIIEKFSVLDITADLFANDISFAIGNDNTVDRRLLPPNSALKRVLNTAEKSRVTKTPLNKKQKEIKPPKEPFFNRLRVVDKSKVSRGRKIEMTESGLLDWKLTDTTEQYTWGHEEFSTVLAEHEEYNTTNYNREEVLKITYKLVQEKVQQSSLNGYFRKRIQLWNRFRQQPYTCLIRPSSFGVCRRDDSGSGDGTNSFEARSNCVIQSFQNLSIHTSQAGSDDDDVCFPPDVEDLDMFSPDLPVPRMSRTSGIFEDDLKSMMVTPPELVQPVNVKFQTEPITLNTEKVKDAIWNIIEKADVTLLSDMHKQLENIFKKEKLPLQFAFAMLLLLANEKCLLLENISNGEDLKIMKDVNELQIMC